MIISASLIPTNDHFGYVFFSVDGHSDGDFCWMAHSSQALYPRCFGLSLSLFPNALLILVQDALAWPHPSSRMH